MSKQKMEIKKIEKNASRQATFSKRKRGIFKKAKELSTLCDADLALIVFSPSGKLFDFASSSVQEVTERYHMQTSIYRSQDQQSHEFQLEKDTYYLKCKELTDKTIGLRHLNGEELQGLKIHELQKLERVLEKGLARVSKEKGLQMVQDNHRLKKMRSQANSQGQSSKSNSVEESDNRDHDAPNLNLGLPMFE
ncbi:MADS-box protein JOINTLESS isoform X3 [Arachis hypogaea]|uniref:MADS-box protein JOINTLESS isoform X3 n=1 Tax=Arachis hypogaea TaxID=3818 RepID=UPI000788B63C